MVRRDPAAIQELLDESKATIATLLRLTTRLEAFTDQLESDIERQEGGENDDGSGSSR